MATAPPIAPPIPPQDLIDPSIDEVLADSSRP